MSHASGHARPAAVRSELSSQRTPPALLPLLSGRPACAARAPKPTWPSWSRRRAAPAVASAAGRRRAPKTCRMPAARQGRLRRGGASTPPSSRISLTERPPADRGPRAAPSLTRARRPQLDHGPAVPRDSHALPGQRAVDQVRQSVLGLCHAMDAHEENVATQRLFCRRRLSRPPRAGTPATSAKPPPAVPAAPSARRPRSNARPPSVRRRPPAFGPPRPVLGTRPSRSPPR